jgi:hypothetical protein
MKPSLGYLAVVLLATTLAAADGEALRSGPQVGAKIPGAFEVRNCNGPDAGDTNCLV